MSRSKTSLSSQQLSINGFSSESSNSQISFGGSLLKNSHAKTSRPLSSKQALHVVLKSNFSKGPRSLLKNEQIIRNLILKQGRRHGVKVFRVVNSGDHLQILLRFYKRRGFQNFLRAISGIIARKVLGAERGRSNLNLKSNSSASANKNSQSKFWSQRPFTQIVKWGPQFATFTNYFTQTPLEVLGFVSQKFVDHLPIQEIRKKILSQISLSVFNV